MRFCTSMLADSQGGFDGWPLQDGQKLQDRGGVGMQSSGKRMPIADVVANRVIEINGSSGDASDPGHKFLARTLRLQGDAIRNFLGVSMSVCRRAP